MISNGVGPPFGGDNVRYNCSLSSSKAVHALGGGFDAADDVEAMEVARAIAMFMLALQPDIGADLFTLCSGDGKVMVTKSLRHFSGSLH